jgi:hypothetical protein
MDAKKKAAATTSKARITSTLFFLGTHTHVYLSVWVGTRGKMISTALFSPRGHRSDIRLPRCTREHEHLWHVCASLGRGTLH